MALDFFKLWFMLAALRKWFATANSGSLIGLLETKEKFVRITHLRVIFTQ